MAKIRVVVVGAAGKMGQEVVRAVTSASDMELVGEVDVKGKDKDLAAVLRKSKPDVGVDFTHPDSAAKNIRAMLLAGVSPVVGTTGISDADIKEIQAICRKEKIGAIIAPNFAIGAVLMMRISRELSPYFDKAEIIELHHDRKVDAPSGTALATAWHIASTRTPEQRKAAKQRAKEVEKLPGARGGAVGDIRIHSVRLPGYVAHQEVIFGGQGQTLTIRHDTTSREAFMPGVLLAIRKVGERKDLATSLEDLL